MTTSHDDGNPDAISMLRAEERLVVGSEWLAVQRVGVRRRIVSRTVQLNVTLRREELVFDERPLEQSVMEGQIPYVPPHVVVLREEVPFVTLENRAYEQVTLSVVQVAGEQPFSTTVDSEQIEIRTDDS